MIKKEKTKPILSEEFLKRRDEAIKRKESLKAAMNTVVKCPLCNTDVIKSKTNNLDECLDTSTCINTQKCNKNSFIPNEVFLKGKLIENKKSNNLTPDQIKQQSKETLLSLYYNLTMDDLTMDKLQYRDATHRYSSLDNTMAYHWCFITHDWISFEKNKLTV